MNVPIKILLSILACAGIAFGVFLGWASLNDFNPPPVMDLKIEGKGVGKEAFEISLLTWNIGYAGLGAEMDFFYDGGKTVIPPEENVKRYLNGILEFLKGKKADFVLLQEVDEDSARSHKIDEVERISRIFPGYAWTFAINYDVKFVPVPLHNPMGKVLSGQMTIGKYRPFSAKRYSLPGNYPWPKKLFMLDRCMIVWRLPTPDGKEWVIVNLHNSAFDEGNIRREQLNFIKDFILKEYDKGNYVVVGGDWNHILPGVGKFDCEERKPRFYIEIPKGWTPDGWKWLYDPKIPTNRSVAFPHTLGKNFVTIIDGFLVSPNVEVLEVKGFDLNFENSDHQPVFVRLKIKQK